MCTERQRRDLVFFLFPNTFIRWLLIYYLEYFCASTNKKKNVYDSIRYSPCIIYVSVGREDYLLIKCKCVLSFLVVNPLYNTLRNFDLSRKDFLFFCFFKTVQVYLLVVDELYVIKYSEPFLILEKVSFACIISLIGMKLIRRTRNLTYDTHTCTRIMRACTINWSWLVQSGMLSRLMHTPVSAFQYCHRQKMQ